MKKTLLTLVLVLMTLGGIVNAQGYQPGDEAIGFNLKNVDGKMVSLNDFESAKGFIVIFTCNHCPYAVAYEDRIISLNKMYRSQGYPVIAINPNDSVSYEIDSYSNMIVRAKEKGFTFPYLLDETQEIAKTYGATRTPHVFLLNKENGKLIVKYVGAIDDNYMDAAAVSETYVVDGVDALLAGKEIETTFTKAVGCSIKWK